MNDTLSLEHNLAEFNRRLAAWNAELAADIDLYDFMELALNTLEAFHWVKSSVAAGAPLKVSSDPDEAIFEFADHFFERWRKVHFSILITGRNSKDEVLEAITPFVIKLCEVYGNAERIMELYSPSQIHRDIAEINAERASLEAKRHRYNDVVGRIVTLRSEASEFEKAECLDEASLKLEEAIAVGKEWGINPSDYLSAYERLFVVYRKLKRYADEERVLMEAITIESARGHELCLRRAQKYKDRLVRCRTLINKSKMIIDE